MHFVHENDGFEGRGFVRHHGVCLSQLGMVGSVARVDGDCLFGLDDGALRIVITQAGFGQPGVCLSVIWIGAETLRGDTVDLFPMARLHQEINGGWLVHCRNKSSGEYEERCAKARDETHLDQCNRFEIKAVLASSGGHTEALTGPKTPVEGRASRLRCSLQK